MSETILSLCFDLCSVGDCAKGFIVLNSYKYLFEIYSSDHTVLSHLLTIDGIYPF